MMEDLRDQMRNMARDYGRTMRDKARASAQKRKEEYLGARVPRELKARVIARADEMGIPVSILIRNVLEEAFATGGDSQEHGTPSQRDTAGGGQTKKYPGVIGWEEITLNKAMNCTSCGSLVAEGAVATLGLAMAGENHVILCADCNKSR